MKVNSMGERLAWARNQQGLTLQQVSERSDLAIGYISQLEKGAKVNPTLSALERLAEALHVTVEFIVGKIQPPAAETVDSLLTDSQALLVGQRFARYVAEQTPQQRQLLTGMSVEQRFAVVTEFLCREFPSAFTRPIIAFQLGLSLRFLNAVLEGGTELGINALHLFARITSIPIEFLASGEMEPVISRQVEIAPAQILPFLAAIKAAVACGVTPPQLLALIRAHSGKR